MKIFSSDSEFLSWLCKSDIQIEINDDCEPYVVRNFWMDQGNNVSHITAKRVFEPKIAIFNWSCIEKIVLIEPDKIFDANR